MEEVARRSDLSPLSLALFGKQRSFLYDPAKFKCSLTSRRAGKTFVDAVALLLAAASALATAAHAAQAPGAAAEPNIPMSHRDRVYASEQFSNTVSVIDPVDNRLLGVVPTRRLLLSPLDKRIADIMVKEVVAIGQQATVLDACEFFILHKLLAFPVVDEKRRIVGVVDVELYTTELADLGDLVVAAYRDAKSQVDALASQALGPLAGGGFDALGGGASGKPLGFGGPGV